MPRPPARAVVASTLSAATLLTTASACSLAGPDRAVPAAPAAVSPAATATGPPTPAAAPTLTEAQARAALITEADLGEPWVPTRGVATWRDAMLKASAESAECRRLLDALYAEELFGPDARTRASVGLDDEYDEAQLRYQVVAHRPAEVDRTLEWLGSLPRTCGQFMARTTRGGLMTVEVGEAQMPEVGDARRGLHIVLSGVSEDEDEGEGESEGESEGEAAPTLTLHVAAIRVGDDAITVTNGGLGDVPGDATLAAVELGAQRLAEVRKRGRVEV
ncbi:hypothetical protein PBV52_24650 [Streptomyces sp. T12]|uniref:hypothetical protein n=2 Tax=unclassified Streptomyces TaxID=2593676 RepID=UPI0023655A06|nr:hypothetical protein [Streptomyces sp. T12]WDF39757.1 hypothetical protein PBV52_24650 [Streptomyces sp. T12]